VTLFWLIAIPVALLASLFVSMRILWLLAAVGAASWVWRWMLRRHGKRMGRIGRMGPMVLGLALLGPGVWTAGAVTNTFNQGDPTFVQTTINNMTPGDT
jgi:hypothetical protein